MLLLRSSLCNMVPAWFSSLYYSCTCRFQFPYDVGQATVEPENACSWSLLWSDLACVSRGWSRCSFTALACRSTPSFMPVLMPIVSLLLGMILPYARFFATSCALTLFFWFLDFLP